MSEWKQIAAWKAGAFDGIERTHRQGPQGVVFDTVGITRSSLRALHRQLGGKIDWYRERIEALR
jgi:hypothetical protein